jgi:pimeloyl-ACP methyl ester carboxylesterase
MIREQRLELAGYGTRVLELESSANGAGAGGEHSLLLIHGFSDSADTWRPLLGQLAGRGRHAVAIDLPGFGQAARLDREEKILPQLDRFVSAAVEWSAARSATGDVAVVGNSLGGLAGMRVAQNDALPIAGVMPLAPAGLDMARWIAVLESAPLIRLLLRTPVPLPEAVVRQAVGEVYRNLAFAHPRRVDGAVVAAFTSHVRNRRDVVRLLATGRRLRPELADPFDLDAIACTVLMVWGDRDRLVFATGADRVLRAVNDSRIELIDDCGHCPQIECPERLAELLEEFPAQVVQTA